MKAIETKYLGPTNSRGSRIKATIEGGNSITIRYDDDLSQEDAHRKAAKALCDKLGWEGELITGWLEKSAVHVFKP